MPPYRSALPALVLLLAACQNPESSSPPASSSETASGNGRALYMTHCASCHGSRLEGQPEWRQRRADGRLPAPPHDDSGHTWHHPMQVLFEITKIGMKPPFAPEGYMSDMPAFVGTLSDGEIRAILTFIEHQWSPETRKLRAERFGDKQQSTHNGR